MLIKPLSLEKIFMLVMGVSLLLLMIQSGLLYYALSGLAAHTQAAYRTTQTLLETLQQDADPRVSQQLDQFREEAQNMHVQAIDQVQAAQMRLLLVLQIGIIMLVLLGVFFIRHLRTVFDHRPTDG